MSKQLITMRVNGETQEIAVEPSWTLLETVREELRLTGNKEGCGTGDCGACSMIVDGRLITSCLMLAVQADGREVITIEGLSYERRPAPSAAGVHRRGRSPVRLLHARDDHGGDGACWTRTPIRRWRRSARAWPATSAGAPATPRSTRRYWRQLKRQGLWTEEN